MHTNDHFCRVTWKGPIFSEFSQISFFETEVSVQKSYETFSVAELFRKMPLRHLRLDVIG